MIHIIHFSGKENMKKIILLLLLSIILSPLTSSPVVLTLEGLISAIRMNNSELIELQQHLIQGELDEAQARARRFGSLEASVGFQFMANPPLGPITTNTDTLLASSLFLLESHLEKINLSHYMKGWRILSSIVVSPIRSPYLPGERSMPQWICMRA